jgi:Reverse transcriptase (RNA-dependent DNA polymerase)
LPELNKAKVFTTLDAKRGFWQLQLNERSSKMTTFWTPFGRNRFVRMPFGIAPAMEIYQQRMNELIAGLDGVEIMGNDILVYGKGESKEEAMTNHNINLEKLLIRVKNCNLTLNKEKAKFCQESVQYFGRAKRQRRCSTNIRNVELFGKIHPKFVKGSRTIEKNYTPRGGSIFVGSRTEQGVQSDEATYCRSTNTTVL